MLTSERPGSSRDAAHHYARFSLALIGLMCVYSFLNYYHQFPWTTFYQEWGTAVLGLGGATLLLGAGYWRQAELPRIVALPVGLLLLVVVQYALGKIPYFGQMLLIALYLMWAALLMLLGARLREMLGLAQVATVLAVFLVVGAELGAILGMYQHFHWHSFLDQWVTVKISPAVFGNVAQPNHYADYETLGLVSLGLLYARGALRAWQAALLALPILFVLPLTGSREIWLYLGGLSAATLVWQWRNRAQRPLLYYSLLLLAGFGLMHLAPELPWFQVDASESTNTVARMFGADVSSGSIRLRLWPEAGRIFLDFPLLGAGFGQYAWEHFLMTAVERTAGIPGLYNNAHNLVLQIAAEDGLVGLALLFGTLSLWVIQAWRAERTIYHWWGYALLMVLGIHSLLEYPLWYAYFLGIAALALGLLDGSRFRVELRQAGRGFMALTLLLGMLSLLQLFTGYRTLERLNQLPFDAADQGAYYYAEMKQGIAQLQGQLLLQPYADLLTARVIPLDSTDLDYKLELSHRTERFIPSAEAVYRHSMLLALSGNPEAAQREMERGIWAYPADYAMAEGVLGRLVARDPAHFNALLEFAIRKHEEYGSAVYPN